MRSRCTRDESIDSTRTRRGSPKRDLRLSRVLVRTEPMTDLEGCSHDPDVQEGAVTERRDRPDVEAEMSLHLLSELRGHAPHTHTHPLRSRCRLLVPVHRMRGAALRCSARTPARSSTSSAAKRAPSSRYFRPIRSIVSAIKHGRGNDRATGTCDFPGPKTTGPPVGSARPAPGHRVGSRIHDLLVAGSVTPSGRRTEQSPHHRLLWHIAAKMFRRYRGKIETPVALAHGIPAPDDPPRPPPHPVLRAPSREPR